MAVFENKQEAIALISTGLLIFFAVAAGMIILNVVSQSLEQELLNQMKDQTRILVK